MQGVSLQSEGNSTNTRKPCFALPFDRDRDFVDRPDVMAWLKDQYKSATSRIALVGMGGFGYELAFLSLVVFLN